MSFKDIIIQQSRDSLSNNTKELYKALIINKAKTGEHPVIIKLDDCDGDIIIDWLRQEGLIVVKTERSQSEKNQFFARISWFE